MIERKAAARRISPSASRRFRCAAAMEALLAVALLCGAAPSAHAKDSPAQPVRPALAASKPLVVDDAWGGTGVSYDAVSSGRIVYIAYYDADRVFTVARVDTATGAVQKKALSSRFVGWDAHNSVTLELDGQGNLHVSGNMHTAPLVYARTTRPGDLASLTQTDRMVGSEESSVTYPRFFKMPNGDLAFDYRSGKSGDGEEFINRFDGERWSRLMSQPLFAPAPGGGHVNAYHTDYTRGPDGRFHVAWVWRRSTLAETNFNVSYARSSDLRHWEDSQGRPLALPITPANAEVAAPVAQRSGLMNNIRIGFDLKGAPVISYLAYDAQGDSQLFHARPSVNGWQRVQATNWRYRWDFGGKGSLVSDIGFSGVRNAGELLTEDVTHRQYGHLLMALDPVTLAGTSQPAPPAAPLAAAPSGVSIKAPFRASQRSIRPASDGSVRGTIRWANLGSNNNDKPRTCASLDLPADCRMGGPLELFISVPEGAGSAPGAEQRR